jgi:vancomycin resistance protein YoaR
VAEKENEHVKQTEEMKESTSAELSESANMGAGKRGGSLRGKGMLLSEAMGRRMLESLKQTPLAQWVALERIQPVPLLWTSLTVSALVVAGGISLFLQPLGSVSHADSTVEENTDAADKEEEAEPEPLPLIVVHGDQRWETDLREWGYDGEDPTTLDKEKWEEWLNTIAEEVRLPAQNARVKRFGAAIQPAKEGRKLDLEAMNRWLDQLPDRLNQPEVIPTVPIPPKVTESDIKRVNEKRIGTYTTYLNAGNVNRTTNVRLSSESIHNRVLNPGEEFSFNQTVGQRTAARGYKPATIIVKGEYSEGLGGGICQTSSTLYNSVDNAGLEITARYSHSAEVTYVPKGRDATVAWHGPDFRFRNNLNKPILIRSFLRGGTLTVEIYTSNDTKSQKRHVPSAPTEVKDVVTNQN